MSLYGSIASALRLKGYGVDGGVVALDGSNPTPVVTQFDEILTAFVALKTNAAPGDAASVVTWDATGGTLNIYAWQNTDGTDPTLVASASTTPVGWIVIGRKRLK